MIIFISNLKQKNLGTGKTGIESLDYYYIVVITTTFSCYLKIKTEIKKC
jgi:hypothetical protein